MLVEPARDPPPIGEAGDDHPDDEESGQAPQRRHHQFEQQESILRPAGNVTHDR
jgi:hypothetical protein